MNAARGRRDESDLVVLELVRLASLDTWNCGQAAHALLAKRHSPGALRIARGRVQRARAEAPTLFAERAADTLTAALALLDGEAGDAAP